MGEGGGGCLGRSLAGVVGAGKAWGVRGGGEGGGRRGRMVGEGWAVWLSGDYLRRR